ncbi:MAG: hypothetical protein IK148_09120 [Prevotella sp.]|nr:hypothetical protein [Prevotella sp.]
MKKKKNRYIVPLCEDIKLSDGFNVMLVLSVHDEETEIVGAKENSFDFDDDPWADDPWADTPVKDPWEN